MCPAVSTPAVRTGWRPWLRAGLLWVQLVVIGGALVYGVRGTSLDHLQDRLYDGKVDAVTVAGGMPPGSYGSGTQQVSWREGLVRYQVEVTQVAEGPQGSGNLAETSDRFGEDIGDRLVRQHPGLTVHREHFTYWAASFLGWRGPAWVAMGGYAVVLLSLGLLLSGGQHWRATRWAWFWLISTPPGVLAYLALSGPMWPWRPPRDPARRLTGGWAFLLCIVITAILRGVS